MMVGAMKNIQTIILAVAVCAVALGLFATFRTMPASRLWKGYRVLCVRSGTVTDEQVYALLENSGCRDVVARTNQGIPLVSRYSPVQVQAADSYLAKRNAFFRDEHDEAMVFYVPEGQDAALSRALDDLQAAGVAAATDGAASFPWISPVVCAAFALVCVLFARRRLSLAVALLFLLAFSVSRPFATTSAAVCLASYGFFLLQKIWGRHGFVKSATRPLVVVCLCVPVVLLSVSSPLGALFYVVAVAAGGSAALLAAQLKTVYDERRSRLFAPVPIRSARFVPLIERTDMRVVALLVLAAAVMLVFSLMRPVARSTGSSLPPVPAPVAGAARLPDWDDFLAWSWQTVTFPYRRLSDGAAETPVEGECVVMREYADEGGVIAEREQTAFVYNGAFRSSVHDSVRKLPYPALEKMLLRQGRDARYSYATGAGYVGERFGVPLLAVFVLIPAGIIGYVMMARKQYGISF